MQKHDDGHTKSLGFGKMSGALSAFKKKKTDRQSVKPIPEQKRQNRSTYFTGHVPGRFTFSRRDSQTGKDDYDTQKRWSQAMQGATAPVTVDSGERDWSGVSTENFVSAVRTLLTRRIQEEGYELDKEKPKKKPLAEANGLQAVLKLLQNQDNETTEEKLRRLERPKRLRRIIFDGIDIWLRRAVKVKSLESIIELADVIVPVHEAVLKLTEDEDGAFNDFREIETLLKTLENCSVKAKDATLDLFEFLSGESDVEDLAVLLETFHQGVTHLKGRLKKIGVPESTLFLWCPYRILNELCGSAGFPGQRVKQLLGFFDIDAWRVVFAPQAERMRHSELRKSRMSLAGDRDSLFGRVSLDFGRGSIRRLTEGSEEDGSSSSNSVTPEPTMSRSRKAILDQDTRNIWEKIQDTWTKLLDSKLVIKNVESQHRGGLMSPKRLADGFVAQELDADRRTLIVPHDAHEKALKRPPLQCLPFVKFEPYQPPTAPAPVMPALEEGIEQIDLDSVLEEKREPLPSRLQQFPMRAAAPKPPSSIKLRKGHHSVKFQKGHQDHDTDHVHHHHHHLPHPPSGMGASVVAIGLQDDFGGEDVRTQPATLDSREEPWWKDVRISPLTDQKTMSAVKADYPRQWGL